VAFNFGVFMGYASILNTFHMTCLPLYIGGIFWTLFYDTVYAFQDIEHDKKLNLHSTAITFEKHGTEFLNYC
jgi:4-hydroxybenzoate polyprenyltransferase